MKIIHCSSSVSNTSAVTRLHRALLKQNIDSRILTLHNNEDIEQTKVFTTDFVKEKIHHYSEAIENVYINKKYHIPKDIPFCFGRVGYDIVKEPWIQEADIIHLHWVSGNFLSVRSIYRLLKMNKKVIWTLHDSWTLTGGCHVKLGCENYVDHCGDCPILLSKNENDRSKQVMQLKEKLLIQKNLSLVAPSTWMLSNIQNSSIFSKVTSCLIPNTLDLSIYKVYDKKYVAQKLNYEPNGKINLLFGAIAATSTSYKGFQFLKEALKYLSQNHPEIAEKVVLHIFGSEEMKDKELKKYDIKCWGFVKESQRMAYIYNLADIYVFPSIDDNLPSTVMESLACGTPVTCFETGGVPDMVHHKKNGYIAKQRDSNDLMKGIVWTLENNIDNKLGIAGHSSVCQSYNERLIAKEYIALYHGMKYE